MAMTRPISEQVKFTQEGAGAVERLASEKLREVVSVKDFGAVGDGVTDDTAAIQNAVNAALNVLFPLGTYYVTAPINVHSFSKLNGESYQNRTSQIRLADGITFVGVANARVRPDFDELLNVNLHGLGFYGTGASVVNIADASRIYLVEWVVENCWFGWSLENCFRSRFVTSEFLNNRFGQNDSLSRHASHSHLVMKGVVTPVFAETNVIGVRNNRFDSAPATGNTIYAELGYMMRVDNNTIQGNDCPLRIFGVVSVSLTDNYFEKNTAEAIIVAGEDTQSQGRYTDITLENNYIFQEAPISTVVSVVSRPDRTFARFQTNYIRFTDGGSFYLTTSSLGNDRNIMSSEGNFARSGYAGALATNYVNGAMHTTTHLEDAVTEVAPNMGHRVVSGLADSAHGIWSSRPDINGLLGGSDFGAIIDSPENAHLILGLRTDDINDSVAILSNHGGAAKGNYDTLVARFRRDGVTTLPGVYGSTSAASANVVVSSTGVLQRATSSARWKELIRPLELDTAFIYKLEPRTFDYKDGGPKGVSGFIAESVFDVEPSAASVDAEGLPDGINWNAIIVALVAEVKRLKARLDSADAAGIRVD